MGKKQKMVIKPKFDWGGFKLLGGFGVLLSALGVLLFWATYTAPASVSESYALSTGQRLVRMLPTEAKSKIAMVISVLFVLFGLFLILTATYRAIRFILFKR
jgi:protein-S-isoprenylcysteine O-methyltransferase Ste14